MQPPGPDLRDHVIIAGYGVPGRYIAELLRRTRHPFILVDLNPETCRAQAALGVQVINGDISEEPVLHQASVETATILALGIPDESAALRAARLASTLHPGIHIIAWTQYKSSGLKALQAGANEVIVAEETIAQEFYRRIDAFMKGRIGGGPVAD